MYYFKKPKYIAIKAECFESFFISSLSIAKKNKKNIHLIYKFNYF